MHQGRRTAMQAFVAQPDMLIVRFANVCDN